MNAMSGTTAGEPFDLLGPLPSGTVVLEASAGTGKTYAIAGLVTRLVAEGRASVDQVLAVTFGRAASRELRGRIRERIVQVRAAMADRHGADAAEDPLVAHLGSCSGVEFAERLDRLDAALSRFDTATVATIHEFCGQALRLLGISVDASPSERLTEDLSAFVDQTIADVYAARYAAVGAEGREIPLGRAMRIGRDVAADPMADIELPVSAGTVPAAQQGFAVAVREALARRQAGCAVLGFDDLIARVHQAVTGPSAEAAVALLRDRYRVVLVDEFQDTDAAQWAILEAAFHGHTTLVLIGDPKQAIYGFRGGDIEAYLAAVGKAGTVLTLGTNHRSDAALVAGVAGLFGPTELGDSQIVVRPIGARHAEARLRGAGPAVRLRVLAIPESDGRLTPQRVGPLRERVAADVAADIVALISSGAEVAQDGRWRAVTPGDVAVLVRSATGAAAVTDALQRARVPAILRGGASVFTSRAAGDWLTVLRAIEQTGRPTLVREAAITPFFGRTGTDLVGGGEAVVDEVATALRQWLAVWQDVGLAAMLAKVMRDSPVVPGLLGSPNGERDLTDVRHVAEALQQAAREGSLGPGGLVRWLEGRIAAAQRQGDAEVERRLASDARAVTVQTLHVSKGLQFPIVYVPYGWDRFVHDIEVARFHDSAGRRRRDARGDQAGRSWVESVRRQRAEESGEELRLLYVGLTRAAHQVVAHWAGCDGNTPASPLHRLLCARASGETTPKQEYGAAHPWQTATGHLTGVAVETVPDLTQLRSWSPPMPVVTTLESAAFDRELDTSWRRTSYSGLTAGLHGTEPTGWTIDEPDERRSPDEGVGTDETSSRHETSDLGEPSSPAEHEPGGRGSGGSGDAQSHSTTPTDPLVAARSLISPMVDMVAGTRFGTLVHAVLQTTDTTAGDLHAELTARVSAAMRTAPVEGVDADGLATALLPSLRTPLGPLAGGRCLADIPPSDRLAELGFEMPLSACTDPTRDPTIAELADLWRAVLPGDDPTAAYPDRLESAGLGGRRMRGFLSGEIDAVLRIRSRGTVRYLVVDYKTNRLGPPRSSGELTSAWHYRPAALPTAMIDAHYPLQALIYSAALHRYLRHRQPGYDPDRHLGGVLYLFVRGMCGPDTPTDAAGVPCGVFSWRPPTALVTGASDLFSRSAR